MKRLFSFMLAMALILSLGVEAFADDTPVPNGTITITNTTVDHTYAPYLIFDATITTDKEGNQGVSYSIKEDNQFFDALFQNPEYVTAGPYYNPFFVYNPNTGGVTKRDGVNDSELVQHLKDLIYIVDEEDINDNEDTTDLVPNPDLETAATPVKATTDTVKFEGLDYGYYLITSTLGTTVTINSNTPKVEVIDKNQEPAPDFDKQVFVGYDGDGNEIWKDENSVSIGDQVTYKIEFTASNFDGDLPIQYYQVHDEKGEGIWAEFNSFQIKVGNKVLDKGYYLNQGGVNTNNWHYLGTGWGTAEEVALLPTGDDLINEADWYLVHLGYDEFRITIPWLEDHVLQSTSTEEGVEIEIDIKTSDTYELIFPKDAEHKFDSPAKVEIIYTAAVEPNASIGSNPTDKNRFNKASASWTGEGETHTTPPDEVETKVYGIGLLKDDSTTKENLAGAKFRIYRDAACTDPVYVIPTDIDGVYMVDSLHTYGENISGDHKATARNMYAELYAARGEDYAEVLKEYLVDDDGKPVEQNNLAVSQVNGKLVVLGLEAGTYYLLEVEAPAGYNALTTPVALTAGQKESAFYVFANADGEVADIQNATGTYIEHKYDVTNDVVHNSKGTVLPSTGGAGTVKMITIGTVIAIGFAILLITNKKMTAYQD